MRNDFHSKCFLGLVIPLLLLVFSVPVWPQTDLKDKNRSPVLEAYLNRYSDLFLKAEGEVIRILKDDMEGTPHQRFIVMTPEGQTILIVHNLHLSARVPVRVGLVVRVYGEYAWNPKGGLIHKTHRSTGRRDPHGWIEIVSTGKRYQ